MPVHQGGQLGDQRGVLPQAQVRLDPLLQGDQVPLLQAGPLLAQRGRGREVHERGSLPQLQRRAQHPPGPDGVVGRQGLLTFPYGSDEPAGVDLGAVDVEPVAGAPLAHDPIGPEDHAQAPRVQPQVGPRRRRRLGAPQRVDQVVGGEAAVRVAEQHREQEPLLARPQDRDDVAGPDPQRTQNLELHDHAPSACRVWQHPRMTATATSWRNAQRGHRKRPPEGAPTRSAVIRPLSRSRSSGVADAGNPSVDHAPEGRRVCRGMLPNLPEWKSR